MEIIYQVRQNNAKKKKIEFARGGLMDLKERK